MNKVALCQQLTINNKVFMTHQDVINHYGNWGVASRALGMGATTYQAWKLRGFISIQTQYKVEFRAKTPKLKANVKDCLEQFKDFI